ncbi:DUF2270 domain-containing protein [Saliphagus sp. GCM10025334]
MPPSDDGGTDSDNPRNDGAAIGSDLERDRTTISSVLGDTYRGEVSRETTWRSRLDQTTTWSVTIMAAILTWAFSSTDNPHYIILIAGLVVTMFLLIEARRYRDYDVYRARVRLMQQNLLAAALDPDAPVDNPEWRVELSDDYRRPTMKVSTLEALANRLRRIYLALFTVLVLAWAFRITAFVQSDAWLESASIALVPGEVVVAVSALWYLAAVAIGLWPRERQAKGEFREGEHGEWKSGR